MYADRWRQSLDEDIQNEEDQQYKVSGIDETAATDTGPSKMSDPPNTEGVLEENGEEFTQSNERGGGTLCCHCWAHRNKKQATIMKGLCCSRIEQSLCKMGCLFQQFL